MSDRLDDGLNMDKWARHCLQLCDRPEEYEQGGISPRARLIGACSTSDQELEQLKYEPEISTKEIRRAREVTPEQLWLSAVLDHFDVHPQQQGRLVIAATRSPPPRHREGRRSSHMGTRSMQALRTMAPHTLY